MKTFIQKCLDHEASLEEVDDYVQKWHQGEGRNLELHEYLGMDKNEYSLWMLDADNLQAIVNSYKHR